ncbi:hypothetical protein Lal_00033472, partial [Lupinus albus]
KVKTKSRQREVKERTRIRQSKLEDICNSTNNKKSQASITLSSLSLCEISWLGTSEVKRARLNALSLFRMFPHESICDIQK